MMALLVAALLPGCGAESEQPVQGSTMTVLLDCCAANQMRLHNLKHLLFLPLIERDGREVRPRLAESWEHSPDYRTWTFRLRDDIRWHDGVLVTAHDIAFSAELFRHPEVLFGARVWELDSAIVLDDQTITFALRKPTYYPPTGVWTVFFPKHLLEDLDPAAFYEWDFWTQPVGNGPYRFVRSVPQTMVEFEANPDFYAGEPPIHRMVAKLSTANPLIELMSGAVDAASDLGAADLLKLDADPRFVIYYENNWDELYLVYWNHRHPLLADVRVRRALNHAVDRRALARLLNLPDAIPLVGGLGNDGEVDPNGRRGWDWTPPYDPKRAEQLLDEAGWVDSDGDGIRERAGREAQFTLLAPQGGSLAAETMGLIMQDQWRSVGIAVEIRPMEMAVVREVLRSGEFDAGIIWENQDAHTLLWTWFGGPAAPGPDETGNERVPFGYYDAEAARLLEVVYATPDPEARDTLYARFNDILRRDMPVMILFPGVYHYAAHRRIRGFRQGRGWLNYPDELWLDPD